MASELVTLRAFFFDKVSNSSVINQHLKETGKELRVYFNAAPKSAKFPMLVISYYDGTDMQYLGQKRLGTRPEHIIRVAGQELITDAMNAVDAEIDLLFKDVRNVVWDGYHITMRRTKPFEQTFPDRESGRPIVSIGGHYNTIMQPIS